MNKYKEAFNAIANSIKCGERVSEGLVDGMYTIRELVDKATPKKPMLNKENKSNIIEFICPTCGEVTRTNFPRNYCGECGQHLDWNEKEPIKEPVKLTRLEHDILEYAHNKQFEYIARDETGNVYVYSSKPDRHNGVWYRGGYGDLTLFNVLFDFIKWEDAEPQSIENLLNNCEVADK